MTHPAQGPEIEGLTFVEYLGPGGYSDVYLYERRKPKMRVAVKVLRGHELSDAELSQFSAEAETMAELADHPYIVQVYSTGTTDDGRPYIVMKYYPPPNLGERAARQRFSVADVLKIGIQISSAVETAHRAGILHRDIKPANILVSQYGDPGLADFGIAGKTAETDDADDLGVSIPWSPPEVLSGASNGSVASDVYSLAATLWHLLAGRSPFEVPGGDNSNRALMGRILRSAAPATGRADTPASMNRLLQQGMSKHPSQRPSSALDFARALQIVEQELRYARTEIVVDGATPAPSRGAPQTSDSEPPPAASQPGAGGQDHRFAPRPDREVQDPRATPAAPSTRMRPARAEPLTPPEAGRTAQAPPPVEPAAPAPLLLPSVHQTTSGAEGTRARPVVGRAPSASSDTRRSPSRSDVPGAPPTERRPTSPSPEPSLPLVAPRRGVKRSVVVGVVAVVIVVTVVVGIAISGGSKSKSSNAAPASPVGTDQGGFTDTGDFAPTVHPTYDATKHLLIFTWSAPAGAGSPARFEYSIGQAAKVGPTTVTRTTVSTTDPSSVCITVATVRSDGTNDFADPVCGS